ncbi:unknown [Choristoneura occidentalis granulovirus]|uniref:ORF6 n=2 Tax=Betabaculovirus chofumiferanae TaxID=3051997 RepID=Q8JL60_GVCF|nr:unknown [Choristoneura fumiferana granulovirus]AAM60759.1 ORF6 [Choristoneura fumiferana granulovirus]ABC61140.1 unknown [Choristoneura fumiferana granulovirus]
MDNILNYEEQTEWNELQDLHIYIENNTQLDEGSKLLIDTLIKGFVEMANKNNKRKILDGIGDLLKETKKAYDLEIIKNEYNNEC